MIHLYKSSDSGQNRREIGKFPNIEKAAEKVRELCRGNREQESYNAIMERGYCMIGYGPDMYDIDDK
jgi:hypothetical protein